MPRSSSTGHGGRSNQSSGRSGSQMGKSEKELTSTKKDSKQGTSSEGSKTTQGTTRSSNAGGSRNRGNE